MVVPVPDSDMMSHEEAESPLREDNQLQPRNSLLASLGRQSSIYSLTLDEFQHTLCEAGKNFGSMNMDEFLNSIWTAEESQAHAHSHAQTLITMTNNNDYDVGQNFNAEGTSGGSKAVAKPGGSISRQGSLTLPAPLCRKTVDEVWSEIHKTRHEQERQQQQQQQQTSDGSGGCSRGGHCGGNSVQNQGSTQRQPTFGEMTLEDFLVKAGVVREQYNTPPPLPLPLPPQLPTYGMLPSFGPRPSIPPYQPLAQSGDPVYNGKRSGGYPTGPPPPAVNYGGRVGGGGYGMGMGSPVSPPSDGMGVSQGDGSNQYGMDMSGMRGGRKRIIDGPVEVVVERRQRRMIKNRESAARSRARKQAYTVELEAELNQLKEENAQLKHALAELERKRKQQYFEEAKMKAQTKAQKVKERMRMMRRSLSGPV